MRILHVNDTLARGGTETAILEMCRWGTDEHLDVRACALDQPRFLPEGVSHSTVDFPVMGVHPRRGLFRCARRLRDHLKQLRPHIVHVHSFFGLLTIWTSFPFLRPFQLVASLRNLGYEAWPARTLYEKFRKRVHGYLLRRADCVVAVSQAVADHYASHLGIRSDRVIPDSVPEAAIHQGLLRETRPGSPKRPIRIVMGGRLVREKGHFIALEALQSLIRKGMKIQFEMVGNGLLRERIEREIREREIAECVWLQQAGSHNEFLSRIADGDICLIPSLCEGFGIVALEAMALGVPVIASNAGGLPEIIEDARTGLIVDKGNAAALAAATERLVAGPELRHSLAAEAKKRVRERFSMERIGPQWLDVYTALTSPSNGS